MKISAVNQIKQEVMNTIDCFLKYDYEQNNQVTELKFSQKNDCLEFYVSPHFDNEDTDYTLLGKYNLSNSALLHRISLQTNIDNYVNKLTNDEKYSDPIAMGFMINHTLVDLMNNIRIRIFTTSANLIKDGNYYHFKSDSDSIIGYDKQTDYFYLEDVKFHKPLLDGKKLIVENRNEMMKHVQETNDLVKDLNKQLHTISEN